MCKIELSGIINSTNLLSDAGADFYHKLFAALSSEENVVVDMTDVSSLPSVFLNVSIGRLIDEIGVDALRNRISFVMITKQQAARLKEYIIKYTSRTNLVN